MININVLTGGSIGTNCYILTGEDGSAVLIDFVPEVSEFIKENNLSLKKLLLTHVHYDHIEGLSSFQRNFYFDFCLSEEAFNFFKNPLRELLIFFPPEVTDNIKNISLDKAKVCSDNEEILWNDHKIKVLKCPGHSPDSLSFAIDELKCVFTGDALFNGSIGRTDLPGGDFGVLKKSIKRLYSVLSDDFTVYPGHGPETAVGFEKKNNPFVRG
jgi:hydroxyacylglutathione hydrolase